MSTLQSTIEAIQDAVLTVSGIKNAPDYAPDKLPGVFPFVVTYPDSGVWMWGTAGAKKGLHSITVELHVSRNDIVFALKELDLYVETIPNAIMKDPTLGGNVDTFGGAGGEAITYQYGPMNYGGVDTMGITFTINNIKIRSAIT
jgi:hypothetical protein